MSNHKLDCTLLTANAWVHMDIHEYRRKRLLALIEDRYGGNRKEFCERGELSESRLAQLLSPSYRGGQGFGERVARHLERILGLEDLYFDLFAIAETSRHAYLLQTDRPEQVEEYVYVPQVELKLTANRPGFKIITIKDAQHALLFHRTWFKAYRYLPEKLLAITVTGISMAPRLYDGDLVVINTADTSLEDNRLYALNWRGAVIIRRATLDFGRWYLSSDNPDRQRYERLEFHPAPGAVIGRVIFITSETV